VNYAAAARDSAFGLEIERAAEGSTELGLEM
jgi:hypothetical protein